MSSPDLPNPLLYKEVHNFLSGPARSRAGRDPPSSWYLCHFCGRIFSYSDFRFPQCSILSECQSHTTVHRRMRNGWPMLFQAQGLGLFAVPLAATWAGMEAQSETRPLLISLTEFCLFWPKSGPRKEAHTPGRTN